jgi:hypothetical protein
MRLLALKRKDQYGRKFQNELLLMHDYSAIVQAIRLTAAGIWHGKIECYADIKSFAVAKYRLC